MRWRVAAATTAGATFVAWFPGGWTPKRRRAASERFDRSTYSTVVANATACRVQHESPDLPALRRDDCSGRHGGYHLAVQFEAAVGFGVWTTVDENFSRDELVGAQIEGVGERDHSGVADDDLSVRRADFLGQTLLCVDEGVCPGRLVDGQVPCRSTARRSG